MKLKNLQISNFRCFDSLSIDLDEQLTVLVAENGVGKTAILDAIAVALGPFIGGFDTGVSKGFKSEDARLAIREALHITRPEDVILQMESQYAVSLIALGIIEGQSEQWSRELTGKKTQTTFGKARVIINYAKKLQQQVRSGEKVTLPIVAYYGTGRLWKQTKTSIKHSIDSQSRLYGYRDALNSESNYKMFEKWFTDMSIAENATNSTITRNNPPLAEYFKNPDSAAFKPPVRFMELEHVRKAIDQCLSVSGWSDLEYEFKWRELVVRSNDNSFMPVARLSDGVKAMLSLTADIAYRCVQLNPHLESPTEETTGIVLIDEIDLHLHPKWQQTVLSDLQKAFHKIQFIVTTHSPQVLTTVKPECIRLLCADGTVLTPAINTYGEESKVALEDLMHTSSRPHTDETDLLQDYLKRINHGDIDSPDVMQLRQTLEQVFGSEYSKLKLADMVISKWKAKRGAA